MITEGVLKEWYTENASRRFPLAVVSEDGVIPAEASDEGMILPNALLVGVQLNVPNTMLATREAGTPLPYDRLADSYRIYLKQAIISTRRVELLFATMSGDDIAKAVWTPESGLADLPVHGVAISPLETTDPNIGSSQIFGYVFFGPESMWEPHTGIYTYTGNNRYSVMVSEECINANSGDFLSGLVVNGTVLTGEVTIEAGENAHLSVEGNTIRVSFSDADIDEGFTTRAELLNAITALYGAPVILINGVSSDSSGNFSMTSPDGSIVLNSLDHGLSVASIAGSPCCDKSVLSVIAQNIQKLNEKQGRLESYLQATAANLNGLQNELSILKMTANQ